MGDQMGKPQDYQYGNKDNSGYGLPKVFHRGYYLEKVYKFGAIGEVIYFFFGEALFRIQGEAV
jgi:hypothetical protein